MTTHEYRSVFNRHRRFETVCFSFFYHYPNDDTNKIGYVIAKKKVKLATKRNQCKRIIRESFRLNQARFQQKWIVVLAKKRLANATKSEMHQCLEQFWQHLAKS